MYSVNNEGHGRDVVLVHGNSLSSAIWEKQLSSPVLARFNLIALDLPGHGSSARHPSDRPYRMDGLVESLVDFLSDKSDPILVGHSFGGHLAMRVLGKARHVRGLMLFGAPPMSSMGDFGKAFIPSIATTLAFQTTLTATEALELAKALSWENNPDVQVMVKAILDADPRVRADLGQQIGEGSWDDEQDMLRKSVVPVCVVSGADDNSISSDFLNALAPELFWSGRVHRIEGAGHCPQLQQADKFNHLLASFISAL